MNSIIEFIINNEYIIMIGLFSSIILLLLIVLIIDLVNTKKSKNKYKVLLNTESSSIENSFKENINEEEFTREFELDLFDNEKVVEKDEIKYVVDDPELEKTKAKLELENLKQELIKMEQNEKKEENIDVIEDKDTQQTLPIAEEKTFEEKQEDNAIISIEQFDKFKGQLYEEAPIEEEKAEKEIPISIDELETLYNTQKLKTIKLTDDFNLNEEKSAKFKNSPIISPVYGTIVDVKPSISIQKQIDIIENEIRKTSEFLETLKELRKSLE